MEKFWKICEILFGPNCIYIVGIGMVVIMTILCSLTVACAIATIVDAQ